MRFLVEYVTQEPYERIESLEEIEAGSAEEALEIARGRLQVSGGEEDE